MSETKYKFDVSLLKIGFWTTIILGILKLTNVIDVSTFVVFLPLIFALAWVFLIIFLIGLLALYFINKKINSNLGDSDSDEITDETP